MPLMLLESQAIRVGIPKSEIELAKQGPRQIPKDVMPAQRGSRKASSSPVPGPQNQMAIEDTA